MIKAKSNSIPSKNISLTIFEYFLLAVCLCVIALRATITEGPYVQSTTQPINISGNVYSLYISGVLIFSFFFWFFWNLCSRCFCYRLSFIEIGLCLFTVSALAGFFVASNKRSAISDFVILAAPVLMAILLVQILDTQAKIKLTLAVVAALSVVSAYECKEQLSIDNQARIEQYEKSPETLLEPLGIKQGSFQEMLFKHRLYTKGVQGFFTNSNSAGSFSLMAFFAGLALFIESLANRKSSSRGTFRAILCGLAVAAILAGLLIMRSKGTLAAGFAAILMFAAYLLFGKWIRRHKRFLFVAFLLMIAAGFCVVTFYGLSKGRLPGGNSMLVRWQYWKASAKMYADFPLTGVGPGNFGSLYLHYKAPEAIEEVKDPHNFVLRILTQYGPIGILGFLAMIIVPLWKTIQDDKEKIIANNDTHWLAFKVLFFITISIALVIVRPLILKPPSADTTEYIVYFSAILIMYIIPIVIFVIALLFLVSDQKSCISNPEIVYAALLCAISGVLLHNLIDFAIFEPGVLTAFWALLAALVALSINKNQLLQRQLKPSTKIAGIILCIVISFAYCNFALLPVVKANNKIKCALLRYRGFENTHELLETASQDDLLDPAPFSLNGMLYMQQYTETLPKQADLLKKAKTSFGAAIKRDKSDFKNYAKLSDTYWMLADTEILPRHKEQWLIQAYEFAFSAVQRYPESGTLRFEMAKISESIGNNRTALENYKKAVEIEDAYRKQFRIMYPKWQMFSRLGNDNYNFALEKIQELSVKRGS